MIKLKEREKDARIRIVNKLINSLYIRSTIGVTGSIANGSPNKKSDIDLFIIINQKAVFSMMQEIYKLRKFQMPSHKVISSFERGKIDVIFLYGEINNIPINIEIYSLAVVKKLLDLKKLTITRFRTRPTSSSLTFGNVYGKSIKVNMKTKQFAEGFLSLLPGRIKKGDVVYVGNHLRKLLFGKIYQDDEDIKNLIYGCFLYFIYESIKNNNYSEEGLINLSIFDKTKKLSKESQKFYRKLNKEIELIIKNDINF